MVSMILTLSATDLLTIPVRYLWGWPELELQGSGPPHVETKKPLLRNPFDIGTLPHGQE